MSENPLRFNPFHRLTWRQPNDVAEPNAINGRITYITGSGVGVNEFANHLAVLQKNKSGAFHGCLLGFVFRIRLTHCDLTFRYAVPSCKRFLEAVLPFLNAFRRTTTGRGIPAHFTATDRTMVRFVSLSNITHLASKLTFSLEHAAAMFAAEPVPRLAPRLKVRELMQRLSIVAKLTEALRHSRAFFVNAVIHSADGRNRTINLPACGV